MASGDTTAIVLPAWRETQHVDRTFNLLHKGFKQFSDLSFLIHAIDDGSDDDNATFDAMQAAASNSEVPVYLHQNPENLGLVDTLRTSYMRLLVWNGATEGPRSDWILKTDIDGDFHHERVIEEMAPYVLRDECPVVGGVRWRPIEREENPYEFERRTETVRLLREHLDLPNLDPPSCGTQLYRADAIKTLLSHRVIRDYDRKWGLDFRIPLLAKERGMPVCIRQIEDGKYDVERRGPEKVGAQFDAYTETIAEMIGKRPEDISEWYKSPRVQIE